MVIIDLPYCSVIRGIKTNKELREIARIENVL